MNIRLFGLCVFVLFAFNERGFSDQKLEVSLSGDDDVSITIKKESKKELKTDKEKVNPFPDPPVEDSKDAKSIINYFCKFWKGEKYNLMYGAMTLNYRKKVSFKKFNSLLEEDKSGNGGLAGHKTTGKGSFVGATIRLPVTLKFNSKRAKERKVVACVVKSGKGYRVEDSGILPIDLNSL